MTCTNKKAGDCTCFIWLPTQSDIYHIQENHFARFIGNKYIPRKPISQQVLSTKQRLWMFLTIRTVVEKQKLINLQLVKHSSK